jgi:hypothetical protein
LLQGTKPRTLKTAPLGFEVAFCAAVGTDAWSYKTEIQVNEREDDLDDTGARYVMPCADSMVILTDGCSQFLNL